MICKNCTAVTFKGYGKDKKLCLSCWLGKSEAREPLQMSQRAWNKFTWDKQEILTKCYEITIPDYQTKKEKAIKILKKINLKNFNKGIDTFQKGVNTFSKGMDEFRMGKAMGNQSNLSKAFKMDRKRNFKNLTG